MTWDNADNASSELTEQMSGKALFLFQPVLRFANWYTFHLAPYYIDKTDLALSLIKQGKHYFLSRPRRFGKSLLLDTLKELFEGRHTNVSGRPTFRTSNNNPEVEQHV